MPRSFVTLIRCVFPARWPRAGLVADPCIIFTLLYVCLQVWGFGGADRFLYGYISKQERQRNSVAPGPVTYRIPTSVGGKQPDGARANAPVWGFGTATRQHARMVFVSQEHQKTDFYGKASPGPAGYVLPPSVGGKQPDGRKQDPPNWTFSKSPRVTMDDQEVTKRAPGPIYTIPATVGPQPNGRFANAPLFGFGASTREVKAKVFLGTEFMAGAPPNVATPGPAGPYRMNPGLGKQVDGKKATSPRCAFAKRSRWAEHEKELASNTVPGPGAYG